MIEQYLWIVGSAIFLFLGTMHLLYTFFTDKFLARDANLVTEMKRSHFVLTRRTTIWNAWIGFNSSHSIGVVFFALINIILAVGYFPMLEKSYSIMILDISVCLFYLWLAIKYWFRSPLIGILAATCCFTLSIILILLK